MKSCSSYTSDSGEPAAAVDGGDLDAMHVAADALLYEAKRALQGR